MRVVPGSGTPRYGHDMLPGPSRGSLLALLPGRSPNPLLLALVLAVLLPGCRPGPPPLTCRLVDARLVPVPGSEPEPEPGAGAEAGAAGIKGSEVLVSEHWRPANAGAGQDLWRILGWNPETDERRVLLELRRPSGGTGGGLELRDLRDGVLLVGRREWRRPGQPRAPGRLGLLDLDEPREPEWIDTRAELDPLDLDLAGSPRLGSGGELLLPVRPITGGGGPSLLVRRPGGQLVVHAPEDGIPSSGSSLTVDPTGRSLFQGGEDLGYRPQRP